MTINDRLKDIENRLNEIIDETVPMLWDANYNDFEYALKLGDDQYRVAHDWCGEHIQYDNLAVKRYGVGSVIFFFKKSEDATMFRLTFNATPLKRR